MDMNVTKRNGKTEKFNKSKITNCVDRACNGLKDVDAETVVMNSTVKLYDGVKTSEIDEALIASARTLIEQEPNYSFVASRLLLTTIYKEIFSENVDSDAFELQYKKAFVTNLKKLIKAGVLNKELGKFDLKRLSNELIIQNDYNFEYIGIQTVADRYLNKIDGKRVETPQAWLMRVAMGLAIAEKKEDREDWAIKFYKLMSSFDYMPSTPTLFYAGNTRSQLSSCFLNTFEDSVFGIFDGLHQEAQKSKYAGGLGMDFTPFRAGGAAISTTKGKTTGAVYVWKMFNDMLVSINQGGKRKGAGCGYLETWHYDIEDFLEFKKNTGDHRRRGEDINTANWIPDLFMEQVEQKGPWYLFSPEETPELHDLFGEAFKTKYWEYVEKGKRGELRLFREVDAVTLWKQMLKMIFETSGPWMTFKDPSNIRYSNQHVGVVHSSNLCTEILLHTEATTFKPNNDREIQKYGETAVCNLGSINLSNHVENGKINYAKLAITIEIGARMLDNVIDINFYPTQEAKLSNTRHRPIGMGSMGWHDMFIKLGIDYDSPDAVDISDSLYEVISYHTILASSMLAKERGQYSSYKGSLWSQNIFPVDSYNQLMKYRGNLERAKETLDWTYVRDYVSQWGMRNSNTMAIAPTATISLITGCSPATEPWFNNIFAATTLSGDFTIINKWLVEDLKAANLWNHSMIEQLKAVDGDITQLRITDTAIKERLASKYKTAFQVNQFRLIEAANKRGIWLDMGASLNLFNDKVSLRYLSDLYTTAWAKGLKTTYYLRNRTGSTIEKSSVNVSKIVNEIPTEILGKACSIDNPNCESCQ